MSITEAAKLAGVSRGTLYNRLGEGTLSRSEGGIDLVELLRVFGPLAPLKAAQGPREGSDAPDVTERAPASPDAPRGATDVQPARLTGDDGQMDLAGLLAHRLDAVDESVRWLRELLEQRERQLGERERELAAVRADAQARLDEREAWWRAQLAATQALLPAPEASASKRKFWRRLLG